MSLHRFEAASVQPLGDTGRTSPRMHSFDGQPLPDKGSQPPSDAVNGVAFRHRSGPEHGPPRPGHEPRLEQDRHNGRLGHRLAVEALHREASPPAARTSRVLHERGQSHAKPLLLGIAERQQRLASAFYEDAASPPSSTTVAPATRAARPVARFGQGRAAPYG